MYRLLQKEIFVVKRMVGAMVFAAGAAGYPTRHTAINATGCRTIPHESGYYNPLLNGFKLPNTAACSHE